jgi:hypothetical protein
MSMAMNPSSIGLSFTVGPEVTAVGVTPTWGSYAPEKRPREGRDGKVHERTEWVRSPHEHTVTVDVTASGEQLLHGGVQLQWMVRTRADGRRAVSVFLVNRIQPADPERPDDPEWVFQPAIAVRSGDGGAAFRPRSIDDLDDLEALEWDRRADELLHRDRPEYAVGHGCAADWDADRGEGATEVRTVILPLHELPRIDPRESDDPGLDMRRLGGSGPDGVPGPDLVTLLDPVAGGYQEWVEGLERRIPELDPRLHDQARAHVDACRLVLRRMREGIGLLGRADATGRMARESFCFANRAMALQRAHSAVTLRRRRGLDPGSPDDVRARWRPFQLAFVLMNLPPLVDRDHPDRRTADLLWFPTGGGKTEAYLGLTAFVLAVRRLRQPLTGHRTDGGVAVLMRYTLRLLTVQQFQRATTLICACEYLRQTEGVWEGEPFSIGLWVGMSATPNRYSDDGFWGDGAKQALEKWKNGQRVKGGTPAQLLHCPWCGATLGPDDYLADDLQERVLVFCSDDDCDFSPTNQWGIEGIPAHTVDEQVYRWTPSLVIATVDKFAQMAWNGRIQSLFGRVQQHCDRHRYITTGERNHPANAHPADKRRGWPRAEIHDVDPFEPPDLVIQDELHLISGPLGTMVGLYETAVDGLATVHDGNRRTPPKIVASTATIRRADRQVGSLFQRKLCIFPPSGLDATDSWFGSEIPPEQAPGRLYLGVFAPGKSVKTALVRVYAALLSRAKALHETDAEAGDAYMTLVGYFNSLRELGGAVRLAEDDIPGRIGVLARRSRTEWPDRLLFERHELTSNRNAEEIPEILGRLERQFPEGRPPAGAYPVDLLFASNMISVGVDIDRLGLMVVNGQPKTTAEYIQATSRVGRQTPGLVVTVYNWTRPRDISHYERFRSYHTALYRFVEPTSVTPFSSRARDKGLAGVLASLVRQGDPALAPEPAAKDFNPTDPWVQEVIEQVVQRAALLVGADGGEETRAEMQGRIDDWVKLTADDPTWSRRGHGMKPDPDDRWVIDQQEERDRGGIFVAPGSLREVENEVHVHLLGMGDS